MACPFGVTPGLLGIEPRVLTRARRHRLLGLGRPRLPIPRQYLALACRVQPGLAPDVVTPADHRVEYAPRQPGTAGYRRLGWHPAQLLDGADDERCCRDIESVRPDEFADERQDAGSGRR